MSGESMFEKGFIQLYTGNGKGKTTAALGQALRAYGAGLKIIILQFMKGQPTSEHKIINDLDGRIEIEQFGYKHFYKKNDNKYIEHRKFASRGLQRAQEVLKSNNYSMIILDEIVNALNSDLITIEEITELLDLKPKNCELILTGSNAPNILIEKCDLVSEVKKIKHYFDNGIAARTGIEK
jgi:cob(I)alamin adenosyltransferase